MNNKIIVLGIGNVLLGDDGFGIHTINKMQEMPDFKSIELIDGGTSVLDLGHIFTDNNMIIVVDSIRGGHQPGTIYKLTPDQLGQIVREKSSLHEVQLLDVLNWARFEGHNPAVIIFGVEPKDILYSMELSPIVQAAILPVITEIKKVTQDL